MVKPLHANITLATVDRSLWAHDHAREADLQSCDPGFLAIESIHHEVVLEIPAKSLSVLVIRLLRNKPGVCSGSVV